MTEDISGRYLERWATRLAEENHGLSAERTARAISGHLLDLGYSQDHLHRWLTWISHHDPRVHDASTLALEAHELAQAKDRRFQVFVPFLTTYPSRVTPPSEWLDQAATTEWLTSRGLDQLLSDIDHRGGLLLRLRAYDAYAAVEVAADIADGFIARAAVGVRDDMKVHREAVVRSVQGQRFPLRRRRRVDVRALERQDRLADDIYDLRSGPVDAALQLLSHLDRSASEVAATSGWSAIEALLTAPGDGTNVLAADRLGALVACSWPRAELTTLAYRRIATHEDELTVRLRDAQTNEAKSELIASEIRNERWLKLADPSDECAIRRLQKLFSNPGPKLADVQRYATSAFRRLYRQRNLVAHGGLTKAVALRASLRTVAPIVGAGIDRIVHAVLTDGTPPLDLAVKAELEVARAGSPDGLALTRLLS